MRYLKTFNESLFSVRVEGIQKICHEYGIRNYTINDDMSIDVDGSVFLDDVKINKLPLKFRNVSGLFACNNNNLVSLEGSPKYVGGSFVCSFNKLSNLTGSPREVYGDFNCSHNHDLISLDGAPNKIGGSLLAWICNLNKLSIDSNITEDLIVSSNLITYIEEIPNCSNLVFKNNPINSLIDAMKEIIYQISDRDDLNYIIDVDNESESAMPLYKEIIDRLNEFEVIKDLNKIDLISLNSLYDFYNAEFDPDNFRNISGYQVY